MGLMCKVVVLSACVVLTFAQDYAYSINQDKVTFRQGPNNNRKAQEEQSFQPSSFQRAQHSPTAQQSFQTIPQVQQRPQQFAQGQFSSQPQEFASRPQSAPAPLRIQTPVNFRTGAANTYIPQSASNGNQNTFSLPPVAQAAPAFQEESDYIPTPVQQQPQRIQSQPQRVQPQPQRVQPQFQPEQSQPEEQSFVQVPVRRPAKVRVSGSSPSVSPKAQTADDLALIQEQNAAAKYAFSSQVQNGIQDNSLQREEVRDGLALRGMYSYSDGFYKRTVQYEADENGYRVINESAEPIGNLEGPQLNINGKAQVATDIDGAAHGYSITADDIVDLSKLKNKQPFRIQV